MFVQRQGLECVLNAIVQVRVVEEILFRRPSLQMQSFEPLDAGYAQRACIFRNQHDFFEAEGSYCKTRLVSNTSLLLPTVSRDSTHGIG